MFVCVFQCGALLCRSLPNIIAGAAPGRVDAAGKEEEKKRDWGRERVKHCWKFPDRLKLVKLHTLSLSI